MRKALLIFLLSLLFLVACGGLSEEEVMQTAVANVSATQTAAPTATPLPTDTPTAEPTATNTSVPTNTPIPEPTETPLPTDTPEPTPTATPASSLVRTELDSGDVLYEQTEAGFSLTLSPDWLVLDLTVDDFAQMLSLVGGQNDSLAFFTEDYFETIVASGIRFYAINETVDSLSSPVPISINILLQEETFGLTLEEFMAVNVSQIGNFFDLTSEIGQELLMLGDLEVGRLSYTVNLITALGIESEVSNTQYIVFTDDGIYIITLGMGIELVESYQESARTAVETFRLTE
ncbi:MAG: hypothetical protein R3D55_06320 [Chloroflexota bacterium]